ncbi:MAG: YCF48-related protein [Spartobacteria bacterium]
MQFQDEERKKLLLPARRNNQGEYMSIITKICAVFTLLFLISFTARAQWSPVTSGTANSLRGVRLLDSGVGYAVGDAGTILKSTDAGATWSAQVSGTTKTLYDLYFFSDTEGVAVGESGLILRTTDGGASWAAVSSGVRDGLLSVSFNGANGICGGFSQDIIYSSDSGATWKVSQKGFFGGGFYGAHMISPTVGFVTGQNSIFQGLQGTTVDGGAHWTFHPFYFNNTEGNADDCFFFDSNTGVTSGVLFDGTGAIARTTDGGTNWNSALFPQAMQGIDFPKPEAGFAVGYVGAILKSSDLGIHWTPQTSGTFFDLFDVHFASDAQTGLAVGAAGTILRTTNGGAEGGALTLLAAASRKGQFEIDLPLTGTPGIECRSGGPSGHFKLAFTFSNEIVSVDNVTISCGAVSSSTVDSDDAHRLVVRLDGVICNTENVTLTLTGVHDDLGNTLASASVPMSLLLGDVNGDGAVDNADSHEVKLDRGQTTDSTNFRADVKANGRIDGIDFALVKSQLGTTLSP